jgi:hypothetical protein
MLFAISVLCTNTRLFGKWSSNTYAQNTGFNEALPLFDYTSLLVGLTAAKVSRTMPPQAFPSGNIEHDALSNSCCR